MDIADFLLELPTPEGYRFAVSEAAKDNIPRGTSRLTESWKSSDLFQTLHAAPLTRSEPNLWTDEQNRPFAGSLLFYLSLLFQRQYKIIARNSQFIKTRLIQTCINSAITASLFNSLAVDDSQTMFGYLFQVLP
jgi:hypothetical protein